jgi:hypothetical protein
LRAHSVRLRDPGATELVLREGFWTFERKSMSEDSSGLVTARIETMNTVSEALSIEADAFALVTLDGRTAKCPLSWQKGPVNPTTPPRPVSPGKGLQSPSPAPPPPPRPETSARHRSRSAQRGVKDLKAAIRELVERHPHGRGTDDILKQLTALAHEGETATSRSNTPCATQETRPPVAGDQTPERKAPGAQRQRGQQKQSLAPTQPAAQAAASSATPPAPPATTQHGGGTERDF